MIEQSKISVLILSHYMFCPPISGGAKRMFAPILNMPKEAGISFSVMYMSYSTEELNHNQEYFKTLAEVVFSHGTLTNRTFQFDADALPPGFPKQVWQTMNKDFLENIIKQASDTHYDIIQVTHPQLAWVVPKLRLVADSKIIMDCQNLEWLVFKRWLEYAWQSDVDWLEEDYKSLKKWEEKVVDWFDDIFCISPIEKDIISGFSKTARLHYVPTGAGVNDIDYAPIEHEREKPYDLVFIGSMNWFPTTDALFWLIKEVMPLVWSEKPDVKLEIIGSGVPGPELIKLFRSNKKITFWGALDNEVPLLHASKIFVSPIRIGAGVRLKNPTAWIAQIPIVATSLSVEGLQYTKNVDVLIGDSPEEFAEHIITLLKNPSLAKSLVENGSKTYVEHYSTEKLMDIWKDVYYTVVGKG